MPKPSLNWLLVFVPLSVAAEVVLNQPVLAFATACLAILPLAGLIGRATEQLALHAGPRVGGVLNATFGNITELIIGVLLVAAGEFDVVKASLIGSIIGNLVLVLGASYLAGGLRHPRGQRFSGPAARVHSSSLLLAVTGMVMPAAFVLISPSDTSLQRWVISGTVAVVLIVLYVTALVFTLGPGRPILHDTLLVGPRPSEDAPEWSPRRSVLVLLAAAVVVGLESELLVRSLEPTLAALHLNKVFIGMFVVAIIGNAAEHASAVVFALRNKMDISIEIAFSSSTQIAMLVAPLLVLVSPLLGHPMDFVFLLIEVVAVTLSTLIVSVIATDGRSNWLEGAQLLAVYVILGVSTLFITTHP
jgi:Ca2+:H+ antiporter